METLPCSGVVGALELFDLSGVVMTCPTATVLQLFRVDVYTKYRGGVKRH